jgi:stringent starvation protein B
MSMSNSSGSDRYYPESLIKAYFNWCTANDMKPDFVGLHDFVAEVLGNKHINFIPSFKTIEEIFNEREE